MGQGARVGVSVCGILPTSRYSTALPNAPNPPEEGGAPTATASHPDGFGRSPRVKPHESVRG